MTLPTYNALRSQRHKLACPECGSKNTYARQVGVTPAAEMPHWGKMECLNCKHVWMTAYTPARSR